MKYKYTKVNAAVLTILVIIQGCASIIHRQHSDWEAITSLDDYDAFIATYPHSELLKQKEQKLSTLEPEIQAYLSQIAREAAGDSKIITNQQLSLPGILPEYSNVKGILWRSVYPQVLSWLKIQSDEYVMLESLGMDTISDKGYALYSFGYRMVYPRAQLICPDGTSITFYSHPKDELRFSSGELSIPITDDPPMTLRGFNIFKYTSGVGVVILERQGSKSVYNYSQ